ATHAHVVERLLLVVDREDGLGARAAQDHLELRVVPELRDDARGRAPPSSAPACAAGSAMKRKVTFRILAAPGSRKPSHLVSTSEEPLLQLSSLYGPVPTGFGGMPSALFGWTITAVAWPSTKGRSGSISLLMITTV